MIANNIILNRWKYNVSKIPIHKLEMPEKLVYLLCHTISIIYIL